MAFDVELAEFNFEREGGFVTSKVTGVISLAAHAYATNHHVSAGVPFSHHPGGGCKNEETTARAISSWSRCAGFRCRRFRRRCRSLPAPGPVPPIGRRRPWRRCEVWHRRPPGGSVRRGE